MSYAPTLVRKSKWFWLVFAKVHIYYHITYLLYLSHIFIIHDTKQTFFFWLFWRSDSQIIIEIIYILKVDILIFIFCEPQGLRNRGEGARRAISPPDFGRNRSRTFSFKRPWITTCPSKFIDLPAGLLSDYLNACNYQPLFPSTIFFFLFWNYLQCKPDFAIEEKPIAIIFTMKFFMNLIRFSSTHKSKKLVVVKVWLESRAIAHFFQLDALILKM